MTFHSGLSDEELVALSKQGDLEAFTSLYRRYFDVVYNRVRYVVPENDVEDLTQEIFVVLLRSLKSFEARSTFRTWFRTLTTRQVADYYRKKNRKEDSSLLKLDDVENLPEHTVQVDVEGRISIQAALNELPDQYREIILMRFAEDLPFNEIARLFDQHPEATKSLFRRAINALSQKLEEKDVRDAEKISK